MLIRVKFIRVKVFPPRKFSNSMEMPTEHESLSGESSSANFKIRSPTIVATMEGTVPDQRQGNRHEKEPTLPIPAILEGKIGWGGRIRTFTVLINSEVSYQLDHAPAGL